MRIIALVSGGLDSTVMAVLARDEGFSIIPAFVDYGQRNLECELAACKKNLERFSLGEPIVVSIPGYCAPLRSGLTDERFDIVKDAFLPCRNMMFLTIGASLAWEHDAEGIAIGLLDESVRLFPDQSRRFLDDAERALQSALGRQLRILSPLIEFTKKEVVRLAEELGVTGTYSCHAGGKAPCGRCIACNEYAREEAV